MSLLSDDLAEIFADTSFTVSVSFGASPLQTTRGFLSSEDLPESDGEGGLMLVHRRTVTIADTALTGLQNNQSIVVDGTTYKIHDRRAAGRGKLKVVLA